MSNENPETFTGSGRRRFTPVSGGFTSSRDTGDNMARLYFFGGQTTSGWDRTLVVPLHHLTCDDAATMTRSEVKSFINSYVDVDFMRRYGYTQVMLGTYAFHNV